MANRGGASASPLGSPAPVRQGLAELPLVASWWLPSGSMVLPGVRRCRKSLGDAECRQAMQNVVRRCRTSSGDAECRQAMQNVVGRCKMSLGDADCVQGTVRQGLAEAPGS